MEKIALIVLLCTFAVAAEENPKTENNDGAKEIEGLKISIIKKAALCNRKAENGDSLTVHYSGFLMNGKEFDSSRKRDQPFTITLGAGMVIPGWEKGLVGMCVGEERKLVIAPELAYGEQGFGDIIPGGSTLIFDIELLQLSEPHKETASEKESEVPPIVESSSIETDDIFSEIDTDGDRQINVDELANHLMKQEGESDDKKSELYTMVGEIFQEDDKNKDGVLSYDEFMSQLNQHDEL